MRCYFMRKGHIVGVEALPGLTDQEAIAKGHELFAAQKNVPLDGFEIWDMARVVIQWDAIKPSDEAMSHSKQRSGI
jgi:hypothetical protein